ncbi:excalibur calcium-binding domain-containing protein [Cellulomonas sp.]|uniref:excalibur calcium-binding domain-containing protein n=1 Tax=Cellulomonas sp. TaxID=40001 RepID=UPI003BAB063C
MRSHGPLCALLGLLVAATATGCSAAAAADVHADPGAATVVGVVDGDTVEVEQDGTTTSVTLLGLDSPSLDRCLGAEAAQALQELLPAGAEVRIEVSGENLAAVYADGLLINAEPARRGLGHTLANTVVTDEVLAAEEEAIAAGVGLFGADAQCTVSAQVSALEVAGEGPVAASASLPAGAGLDEVDRRGAAVAAALMQAAAVTAQLDGEAASGLPAVMVADLRSRTEAVTQRLLAAAAALQQARVVEEQRIEAERVAAEAAAARAAQAAADEAARQAQAAADAEAARVAAEAAAAAAAKTAPAKPVTTAPTAPTPGKAPVASPAPTVYYKSCDAVRAAGAAPLRTGDPGYSKELDRDGDGIACEKKR